MKIKLIDFGVPENHRPFRPHGNDAGADVYMPYDCTLQPGEIAKVPLGFGIEIPDGYAGYVSWSSKFVTLVTEKILDCFLASYQRFLFSSRVLCTAKAALPLTKPQISDLGQTSNPIG